MRTVFVSDFHIKYRKDLSEIAREAEVLKFLASLTGNTKALYLLGDIFDLWFAWDKVIISEYFPILNALANLHASGCKITLLAGNHDFWFNDFLNKKIGIVTYPDTCRLDIEEVEFLLAHGDNYTSSDWRYHFFRWLTRRKIVLATFAFLHPHISLSLGQFLSRSSRGVHTPPPIMQRKENGLTSFAQAQIKSGCDMVIMGHTHQPRFIRQTGGIYINTGDWIKHQSYVQLDNQIISLHDWQTKTIIDHENIQKYKRGRNESNNEN